MSRFRPVLATIAALGAMAAAGWLAWRSPYAEHWRWRRAVEAEHARAETLLQAIALPSGEGEEPAGGRIVVAIGERLTVDETGWAIAQDEASGLLSQGPWVHEFARDDDDALTATIEPLEQGLRAIATLRNLAVANRIIEVHIGPDAPFGDVRRVLQTAYEAEWSAWFRVGGGAGITVLPYSFPSTPEIDGLGTSCLVVHLRADGMFLDRKADLGGPSEYGFGLDVPKVGDRQDVLALEEFAVAGNRVREVRTDRRPDPPVPAGDVILPVVASGSGQGTVPEYWVSVERKQPADPPAILNTDDDVPYGQMMAAFQILRSLGYRVHLAGGPPGTTVGRPPAPAEASGGAVAALRWEVGAVAGNPTIRGALTRAEIEPVVERHMNQLRYCYQRELSKTASLAGKIVVKFVIAEDGDVSTASTRSTTVHSPAVETCINARFMRFRFPPPKGGGIVIVSYPFTFSPE